MIGKPVINEKWQNIIIITIRNIRQVNPKHACISNEQYMTCDESN